MLAGLPVPDDERAVVLAALEAPPDGLAELCAVLLSDTSGGSERARPVSLIT